MKKYFLFCTLFLISCEKYTTEVSDLTMSGKYVVSKLQVLQITNPVGKDSTYLSNQTFVNSSLPDPFDSIKVNDFYIHFTYSNVMIGWLGTYIDGERWKYGKSPNEKPNDNIFYNRVPWTFDAYSLGKIQFQYKPLNKGVIFPVTLQVESDMFETLQLSGFEFTPNGANGTRYRLVMSLTRVGP
jgi:hypothetical protein